MTNHTEKTEQKGWVMKLLLIPLIILNVLWNTFLVAVCIVLLCTGYCSYMAMEKAMTFLEWMKILGFRCITYSGMCLINLVCAIGFTAPEMIEWRDKLKESNKKKEDA